MVRRVWVLLVLVMVIGFAGTAGATLSTIGTADYAGQKLNLIYESNAGLVWLDFHNGNNTWANQVAWAAGLDVTVTLDPLYTTTIDWSTGWRLPNSNTNIGFNQTTSEMGHLYYISLGNTMGALTNTGPFTQLANFDNLTSFVYWSGTPTPYGTAYGFQFEFGYQILVGQGEEYFGIAVHPGEVSAVPEPTTMLLLGSGLLGLWGARRRLKP